MNSKTPIIIGSIAVAFFISLYAIAIILVNPTGGIAGLSKLLTIGCILIGFFNPRVGLFFFVAQAVYVDLFKRVGVYYGAVSMQTVQEILIGPLLTSCALNAGLLVQILFGKVKMPLFGWSLYGIGVFLGLYFLVGGAIGGGDSLNKRLFNAGAASAYTTVIPLCYAFFREPREWIRFVSFQVWLVVPSAGWAIWQYFNGFSDMEWAYARTGLSIVHSGQMLLFEKPRVFGFFGSASALGCLSIYAAFTLWRVVSVREWRWVYACFSLVMIAALVLSTQRSALLSPLIFLTAAFFYKDRLKTLFLYASGFLFFILGIFNATWLLDEGLEKINQAIATDSEWGREVLMVSTFSDRLRGWERLSRADSWSLIGTGKELKSDLAVESAGSADYSHDMINKILMNFGALGLLSIILFGGIIAYVFHKSIWALPRGPLKSMGSACLGISIPVCLMSAAGGDNFTATPYNLAIWSSLAGVFVIRKFRETQELNHLS